MYVHFFSPLERSAIPTFLVLGEGGAHATLSVTQAGTSRYEFSKTHLVFSKFHHACFRDLYFSLHFPGLF